MCLYNLCDFKLCLIKKKKSDSKGLTPQNPNFFKYNKCFCNEQNTISSLSALVLLFL